MADQIDYKKEYEKAVDIINYLANRGLRIESRQLFPNDIVEKLDKVLTEASAKIKEILGEYNENT